MQTLVSGARGSNAVDLGWRREFAFFSTSISGNPGAGGLWTKIRKTLLKGSDNLWPYGFAP